MYSHFGTCYGYLLCFSNFGMLYREKSGNPDPPAQQSQLSLSLDFQAKATFSGQESFLSIFRGFTAGLPDGIFFKPKIPNWVNLGGSCNGRCWSMYFMASWSILWPVGLFMASW
jgi:hypothetical protein